MFRKKAKPKIFCISIQRTGTTSVGKFFKSFGFDCGGWEETKRNNWGKLAFDGNFEKIFESEDFIKNQLFEDGPWSSGVFYKYLFYKFPDAKFILFTRNPDAWFDSMVSHSKGKTLGNTFIHSCTYGREEDYYQLVGKNHDYETNEIDNLLPLNESHREHYKKIYINRNRQALDFFRSKDPQNKRFIHLTLEQKDKWLRLGEYFGIKVPEDYEVHANKSEK